MALAGAVLGGRYVLDRNIGNGGYGEVWHATDAVLLRPVAVKLLHPRYAQRSDALARFQAEARHAGALTHENVARVYDYGEPAGGQPFLVMELVSGPSLQAVLAGGPLCARRVADIVAQAAAGLQAAPAAGLVHRDIKPANIMLAPGGVVKITDFGIAHTVGSVPVTATGEVIGTPGYLSPERVGGQQGTPASDLYALGMVAYECLAGAPPFTGTMVEVALAHRDRPLPPLPPSVPPGVAALVMQLAAKDPAWRPGSAADVAVWAGRLRDGRSVTISSPGRRVSAPRLRRVALTCASIAIAAVIGVVLASVTGFASPHQAAGPSHSGHARSPGTAAQPGTVPGPGSGRLPAASPVAQQGPASIAPAVAAASPGHEQGHGHRHGRSHGHG